MKTMANKFSYPHLCDSGAREFMAPHKETRRHGGATSGAPSYNKRMLGETPENHGGIIGFT